MNARPIAARPGAATLFVAAVVAASVVAAAPFSASPSPPPGTPAEQAAWAKLQTLVGDWKGAYAGSDAPPEPADVRASYKLVSNGTALMETLDSGHDTSMITVYHPDGDRILATHYCAAGNQPRMAAAGLTDGGRKLAFEFVDAANAQNVSELMRSLVVTFEDANHFSQAWTSRTNGRDHVGTFTYTRVK